MDKVSQINGNAVMPNYEMLWPHVQVFQIEYFLLNPQLNLKALVQSNLNQV